MERCHIRIDYDPQEHPEHFIPTGGPEDGRPQRLAMLLASEGYGVTLTHNRHRNNCWSCAKNDQDSVVIAPAKFASGILQLLVERGGFTDFHVDCGMRTTTVDGAQAVIRLSDSKFNLIQL
jgi:hypothetical protein